MKKIIAVLMTLCMLAALAACGGSDKSSDSAGTETGSVVTGVEAIDTVGEDGIDWNHMSMDELYEMAKKEGGTVTIYATTADADTARKYIRDKYPDIKFEYISCDTNTVMQKIGMEAQSGTPMADVLMVKDASGEVFNEYVLWDLIKIYYPADVCAHIKDDMLRFGLPLYSTFNPWFYNTRMFEKMPIESWWDIVEGYNEETQSFKDANGNNTQYWTIFSKDITAPSYAALWAQLIADSDKLLEQYKKQYGKDLTFTYHDHLQNTPGLMELPENNAGVELFWRFSQMTITPLADGDAVVEAVHESVNGPTLGLCSASKLDSYVVSGCDNPAGARLFIKFMMGGDDGQSGCYNVFDKLGHWSVRDDVTYKKSGITYEEVNLTAPDFEHIYQNYPNVKAYWTLWNSTR